MGKQLKFYRKESTTYAPAGDHKDAIFFAKDNGDLLLDGKTYGREVDESSETFKIGDATYRLVTVDETGHIKIEKVEYKAPTMSLTASPTHAEYASTVSSLTLTPNLTAGKGYGAGVTSSSVNQGVGDVTPGTAVTVSNVNANTTWTLSYKYKDESNQEIATAKTATASIAFDQYRWLKVADADAAKQFTVDDIKAGTLVTGLQEVTTEKSGYTYVAFPAKWSKSTTSEASTGVGDTPNGVVFADKNTKNPGGWVYSQTVSDVYSGVNYYVYRTKNPDNVFTYTISKKA